MRDASPGDPGNDDAEHSVYLPAPLPPPPSEIHRDCCPTTTTATAGVVFVCDLLVIAPRSRDSWLISQAFPISRPPLSPPFAPAKVSEPAAVAAAAAALASRTSRIADCTARHALFALPRLHTTLLAPLCIPERRTVHVSRH